MSNEIIKSVFDDIVLEIPDLDLYVKDYPETEGKIGLRRRGKNTVILTYNSGKKGWLDTNAALGPRLACFGFLPQKTKPDTYCLVKLPPDKVKQTYEAHKEKILKAIREWCDNQSPP